MAPINIAIIGLSQSAKTSWAAEGHLPYLLSPRGLQRYHISALLNSSVSAAQSAIKHYNLPSTTKAYGDPHDLAADPTIDLVVCTTRVDVHYYTVKPSLEAGKDVFVEWPVAENVSRARELMGLGKGRVIVGLQARVSPAVRKVREVLEEGGVGRVLSSRVEACSPYSNRDSISPGLSYFLDKKIGGNPITIAFGHMIDFIHSVLGEFETFHSHTQIQHPTQHIIDNSTNVHTSTVSDVPDLLSLHGTLVSGASLIATFRTGPPFPGTKPFVWTINCEHAEIRISSERGPFLQSESGAFEIPIEVHWFESGEVRKVEWEWKEWQKELPARGRNIGMVYELFSEGRVGELVGLKEACKRHEELDGILWK